MPEEELDELFWVKPEGFTELRTTLASAAKERGDAAAAKRVSANRKPTTAAWIVNRLALSDQEAKQRLADLGKRLRAAHAASDGDRIRELSAEQRRLIDELGGAAFAAAEVRDPSAALRDDVTDTLQAAIADPDVMARLGRLTKAERWSGFGEFGEAAPVFGADRGGKVKAKVKAEPQQAQRSTTEEKPRDDDREAARQQRKEVKAMLAAAEQAKAEADDELSERQTDLAVARRRHDDSRKRLQEAERTLHAAEAAYEKAKQASRDAGVLVKQAKARLK
jgi:hypothetical protein